MVVDAAGMDMAVERERRRDEREERRRVENGRNRERGLKTERDHILKCVDRLKWGIREGLCVFSCFNCNSIFGEMRRERSGKLLQIIINKKLKETHIIPKQKQKKSLVIYNVAAAFSLYLALL